MISSIIVKRLILLVPLLIGITLISYCLMLMAPGDPTSMMLDPKVKQADMLRIRQNLGLDRPVVLQYFIWLKHIAAGDLGYSYTNGRPVLDLISERIPATLLLMGLSFIITLIFTIPLGIASAIYNKRWLDNFVTIISFAGMSIPTFWLGLMLILFLSLRWGCFPSSGMLDPFLSGAGFWTKVGDIAAHLVLPLITMTVGNLAGLAKYMKMGMLSALKQDYILSARALGFSDRDIVWKYAVKNAILPVISILGLSIPNLVAGSFIIEYIFAWPGMGRLGVDSIFMRDFPLVMGIILISSILIIVGNLLADVAYSVADPRISYRGRA